MQHAKPAVLLQLQATPLQTGSGNLRGYSFTLDFRMKNALDKASYRHAHSPLLSLLIIDNTGEITRQT